MVISFTDDERMRIKGFVKYARNNVFEMDDILDMMNGELMRPIEDRERDFVASSGHRICYFILDHPNKGRCHYFHIRAAFPGAHFSKDQLQYIVEEFGIDTPLLDEHITFRKEEKMVDINLPMG